jgi:hypothetical protein
MTKVCPQYNRGQCQITEESPEFIESGRLVCPIHQKPLVDKIEENLTQAIDVSELAGITSPSEKEEVGMNEQDIDTDNVSEGNETANIEVNAKSYVCSRNAAHELETIPQGRNTCWCGAELVEGDSSDANDSTSESAITEPQEFARVTPAQVPVSEANFDGYTGGVRPDVEPNETNQSEDIETDNNENSTQSSNALTVSYDNKDYKITEFPAYIGREKCFDEEFRKVLLYKEGVSRIHLIIESINGDGNISIHELKKTMNGTFANGERVYTDSKAVILPAKIELGNPKNNGIEFEVRNG